MKRKNTLSLSFDTLRLEGGLLLPDILERAAQGKLSSQQATDYQIPKGLKLQDEYSRSFQIARAQWKAFSAQRERKDLDAQALTQQFVLELLRDALGYRELDIQPEGITLEERHYPIPLLAFGRVPVVIAPHTLGVDEAAECFAIVGGGSRKKSAFQLTQEFLNASEGCLWGMVSNGRQLRLLRDAATLTRPSFLEFELATILDDERYPDFAALWRLLHGSLAGKANAVSEDCHWEHWRNEGLQEGTRVREGLRKGVEEALLTLGQGFLENPANEQLRLDLLKGRLRTQDYYQQLLRLVYRLIFLFTVEERGLLQPEVKDVTAEQLAARKAYTDGYSQSRLRSRCMRRRAYDQHRDLWDATRVVFSGLARGEALLDLPALGGLFAEQQCAALDTATLSNAALLTAVKHLRWSNRSGQLAPVDYANMASEEMGSVYEGLLELVPEVDVHARRFDFVGRTLAGSTQGNARKLSGSYYTPDSLVQELIKSALEPVIKQRLAANKAYPVAAILSIKVIDPACGSGHFLLAAANRLAQELAECQAQDGVVTPQAYRHALREVISHCIYGVDKNPLAIELARTALWLEGYEAGKPLFFLDHHLLVGDALLGIINTSQLMHGIPDAAFKPLSGDDKLLCSELMKLNREYRKSFLEHNKSQNFSLMLEDSNSLIELLALEQMPDDNAEQIAAKEKAYRELNYQISKSNLKESADLFVGVFLSSKNKDFDEKLIPDSRNLFLNLYTNQIADNLKEIFQSNRITYAKQLCADNQVLHWPVVFAQVFANNHNGFDCVLGNPPWEVPQLGEEEYFSSRAPQIAELSGKARKYAITQLHEVDVQLWNEYLFDKRHYEACNIYYREGGRFPLSGKGKINTYSLFAELISQIITEDGRAGFVVPSGIATDDSNKNYFSSIVKSFRLVSLFGFDNAQRLFSSVHPDTPFALVTLGFNPEKIEMSHYLLKVDDLRDIRRRFSLGIEDLNLINPNTNTCPVLRSQRDVFLTKQLYNNNPVLIYENEIIEKNHWNIEVIQNFFSTSNKNDRDLFLPPSMANDRNKFIPVFRGTMIDQFDHRASTYSVAADRFMDSPIHRSADFEAISDKYLPKQEVNDRLVSRNWTKQWLIGWRDITNATNKRTLIATVLPIRGADDTLSLILPQQKDTRLSACLLANLNMLVLDYIAQIKVGGTHVRKYVISQLPVIDPGKYIKDDFFFIIPRVLELTYTSYDLKFWAEDLGFDGKPFTFDIERRSVLRAELDAYYARLYGLERDELRYILDPAEVMGDDYPSETFRVLKNREMKEFGEYRTRNLVMREFDRMELAARTGKPYASLLEPTPGIQTLVYSPQGTPRSASEAWLAGLMLDIVRTLQTVERPQLEWMAQRIAVPQQVSHLLNAEESAIFKQLIPHDQTLFTDIAERIPVLIGFLRDEGLIRYAGSALVTTDTTLLPQWRVGTADASHLIKLLQTAVQAHAKQMANTPDAATLRSRQA